MSRPADPKPTPASPGGPRPLLARVAERDRAPVAFSFDGRPLTGLAGDTVLTAVLAHGARLRVSEFGHGPRAGFCLMGACQDCWVRTAQGQRLRACSTPLVAGMELYTLGAPEAGTTP